MSVSIGAIEGSLKLSDEFAGPGAAFAALTSKLSGSVDALTSKLSTLSKTTTAKTPIDDTEKLRQAYVKLAGQIDPVIAGQQKLTAAHTTLAAALSKGLISQQQHNDLLDKAKQKYAESTNPLETLKSKVGELSGVISRFGGEAGEGLARVAERLSGLAEGGAGAVVSLGPLVVVAAALAVALAAVSVGVKAFDWLKEVVVEGSKTEIVVAGLEQTLKSAGAAAGYSSAELIKYGDAVSVSSGKSKEEIIQAEGVLAHFDKLGHDIMPLLIQQTVDYARSKQMMTGQEVSASEVARKLGAAYEGNTKSLRSLKEEGVVFSSGQIKTMQAMIDHGHIVEYQQKLYEILQEKVKGAADAYRNTLEGSVKAVGNEYKLFKETIASGVIPALEDLFKDVVKSFGGWEHLHDTIQYVAKSMSYDLAMAIYTVRISLNELGVSLDKFDIKGKETVLKATQSIADIIASVNKLPFLGPVGGENPVLKSLQEHNAKVKAQIDETTGSIIKQTAAITQITMEMGKWKPALEGSEKVHENFGSAADDVANKLKAEKEAIDHIQQSVEKLNESLVAMVLKIGGEISDRARLITALTQGDEAYKRMQATIAAEKQIRGDLATLLKEYQSAEAAANTELEKATKLHGANSPEVVKLNNELSRLDETYAEAVIRLKELNKYNVDSADALKKQEEAAKATEKAISSYGKSVLDSLKETEQFKQKLSAAQASYTDNQAYLSIAEKYGKAVADLVKQYGYLDEAAKKDRIDTLTAIKVHKDFADGVVDDVNVIRAKIKEQQDQLDVWRTKDMPSIWQPLADNFATVDQTILDGIVSWKGTAGDVIESIAKNLLDSLLKAFEQITLNWIKTQQIMLAIEESRAVQSNLIEIGNSSAGAGAGVTGLQSGGLTSIGMIGGAGSAGGAGASSGLATAFQAYGSYASYAFLAWVGYNIYEGWTRTRISEGMASIGGQISGDIRLGQEAQRAILQLTQQIDDLAKAWHLGLVSLTSGSVSINITSKGEIVVKTLIDNVGQVFKDMASALDYAKTKALEFATFSKDIDKLVQEAIKDSKAATTAGIQSDIDFGTKLATQNLPQVASQMHAALQTMLDDFRRAMDLFGPNGFLRSLSDFSQLGNATQSVLTNFTTSLRTLYDQLTGHQQDAAQLAEQQRLAYNQQAELIRAQITLLILDTQARIANLQAQLVGGAGRGGGGGTERRPGGDGTSRGEGGGTFADDVIQIIEDRNPTNNPQMAALLQVLDNLVAALTNTPPDIAPGGVVIPGGGGGLGRGAGSTTITDKQAIKWEDQQLFQMSLSGMGALQAQLAQIHKTYADELAQLSKHSKERQHILDLEQQEIQLATKKQQETVNAQIADATGQNDPLAQIKKKFADLVKAAQDAQFGAGELAIKITDLAAAEDKAIDLLAKQTTSNLLGELAGYITDAAIHAELLRQQEIINFEMKLNQMVIEYNLAVASGKVSAASQAIMDKAWHWIWTHLDDLPGGKNWNPDPVPAALTPGGGSGGGHWEFNPNTNGWVWVPDNAGNTNSQATSALQSLVNAFRQAKEGIQSFIDGINVGSQGIVLPIDALKAAESQFNSMYDKAKLGDLTSLQGITGAAKTLIDTEKAFSPELAATDLPKILDELSRLTQLQTVHDPNSNLTYTEAFGMSLQPVTQQLSDLNASNADISLSLNQNTAANNLIVDRLSSMNSVLTDLSSRIAVIESGSAGQKRTGTNG